jgi:hypothetical protein
MIVAAINNLSNKGQGTRKYKSRVCAAVARNQGCKKKKTRLLMASLAALEMRRGGAKKVGLQAIMTRCPYTAWCELSLLRCDLAQASEKGTLNRLFTKFPVTTQTKPTCTLLMTLM